MECTWERFEEQGRTFKPLLFSERADQGEGDCGDMNGGTGQTARDVLSSLRKGCTAQTGCGLASAPHKQQRTYKKSKKVRATTRSSSSYFLLQLSRRSSKMRKNFYDAVPALISMIVTMTWTFTSRMEEAGEVLGTSGSCTGLPPGR